MALTLCPDIVFTHDKSDWLRKSDESNPSRRQALKNCQPMETYTLQWTTLSATNAGTLRTQFESTGFHKSFDWTPPGGSQAKYKFKSFSVTPNSAGDYSAQAELTRSLGVF